MGTPAASRVSLQMQRMAKKMTNKDVPRSIQIQLAKSLDILSEGNWEAMAEKLNYSARDVRWIKSKAINTIHNSCTLSFFDDLELNKHDVTLDVLTAALQNIQNYEAANILQAFVRHCYTQRCSVFVTYALEDERQLESVLQLCNFLRDNDYVVAVDTPDSTLDETDRRLARVRYVLVLISPLYYNLVTKPLSATNSGLLPNLVHIYKKCVATEPGSHRDHNIIPVLMPGASVTNIPPALHSHKPARLSWPENKMSLVQLMM